jgi:hypothetical protein
MAGMIIGGDIGESRWSECVAAVDRLRSLHVSAGNKLSEIIVAQCGDLLLEPAEHEITAVLDVGAAWILEVYLCPMLSPSLPGECLLPRVIPCFSRQEAQTK